MERRITDEQAKSIAICASIGNQCLCNCAWFNEDRCPFLNNKPTEMEVALSSDLLDAVETIRVMREAIRLDRARFDSFACSFQSRGIISEMERAKLCEKDCLSTLESTKGYE